MGRHRKERQRRARQRQEHTPKLAREGGREQSTNGEHPSVPPWLPVTVAVALILFAGFALIAHLHTPATVSQTASQASASTPASAGPIIDGIPCTDEDITYHVHAFLEIYDRGKSVPLQANTGILNNSCFYWLHTHDDSGEIHIEEPHQTRLTLGNFFDIWHQPLSRTQAASAKTGFDAQMRVIVNFRLYNGNPRNIVLHPHEMITIEVGPPWVKPTIFDFGSD